MSAVVVAMNITDRDKDFIKHTLRYRTLASRKAIANTSCDLKRCLATRENVCWTCRIPPVVAGKLGRADILGLPCGLIAGATGTTAASHNAERLGSYPVS